MRRSIIIITAAFLTVGTAIAGVGPAPREARQRYEIDPNNVAVGGAEPITVASTGDPQKSYSFPIKKGERYVSVRLVDENEGAVGGVVTQWVIDQWYGEPNNGAGTGHAVTYVRFCNKTKEPVRLKPKIEVEIIVHAGTCADGTPSTPTSGTITAEFSK